MLEQNHLNSDPCYSSYVSCWSVPEQVTVPWASHCALTRSLTAAPVVSGKSRNKRASRRNRDKGMAKSKQLSCCRICLMSSRGTKFSTVRFLHWQKPEIHPPAPLCFVFNQINMEDGEMCFTIGWDRIKYWKRKSEKSDWNNVIKQHSAAFIFYTDLLIFDLLILLLWLRMHT